jgi:hypothetical protein
MDRDTSDDDEEPGAIGKKKKKILIKTEGQSSNKRVRRSHTDAMTRAMNDAAYPLSLS